MTESSELLTIGMDNMQINLKFMLKNRKQIRYFTTPAYYFLVTVIGPIPNFMRLLCLLGRYNLY